MADAPQKYTISRQVRLSVRDLEIARRVARHYGLSFSALVRMLISREHDNVTRAAIAANKKPE